MKANDDLVRCVSCWEGFDWPQTQRNNQNGQCPRCGRMGEVIEGGFLVFAPEQPLYPAGRTRLVN